MSNVYAAAIETNDGVYVAYRKILRDQDVDCYRLMVEPALLIAEVMDWPFKEYKHISEDAMRARVSLDFSTTCAVFERITYPSKEELTEARQELESYMKSLAVVESIVNRS